MEGVFAVFSHFSTAAADELNEASRCRLGPGVVLSDVRILLGKEEQ
jgi:hypothetical protein